MPEDETIEEEISEQDSDPEAEAGFDEFAADESEGDEKPAVDEKPEGDEKSEGDEKPEDPDKKDEKPEDKPADEKPVDGEKPAQAAIDKRVDELDVKPEDDKKPDGDEQEKPDAASKPGEAEKPVSSADEQQPPAKTRLTKEQVAQHLSIISDDELPEGEIIIGDDTIDFKAIKEDDPAIYNAMKVMSSIAGAKYLNHAVQSGKLVTADAFEKMRDEFGQVVARLEFSTQMGQHGHGDVLMVIDSKEYKEWIPKQSAGVRVLAESDALDDSVLVMDYYKESLGKAKTSDFDEKAEEKHKRTNDLLKGNEKTTPAGPKKKKADKNDDQAAFDEFAE